MPIYRQKSGALQQIKQVREYTGGQWLLMKQVHGRVPGQALVKVHSGVIELTISADTENYNIFSAAGSPSGPSIVIVNVNPGVTVGSLDTSLPAMDTGTGWHPESIIKLKNYGTIMGMGGAAAQGDVSPVVAAEAGGDALRLQFDLEITNAAGYIYGGGGGGGYGDGCCCWFNSTDYCCVNGGGGGGGAGYGTSSGGKGPNRIGGYGCDYLSTAGGDGGPSGPGAGAAGRFYQVGGYHIDAGEGGNGGDFGSAGGNGEPTDSSACYTVKSGSNCPGTSNVAGAAGGKAVDLNGHSVQWVSGNTSTRVKGAVA